MKVNIKKPSIAKDYIYFSCGVMSVIVIISALSFWYTVESLKKERNWVLDSQTQKISMLFEETFAHVTNFMHYMGQKLVSEGNVNPYVAAKILKNEVAADRTNEDCCTWTVYDFVTPNGHVIASSMDGLIKNPKTVYPGQRTWITEAPKSPWQPITSKPDKGITSGKSIIPMGFGITNHKGRFLGTFSMGFDIEKFASKLAKIIDKEGVSFAVVDNDLEIIMQSPEQDKKIYKDFFRDKLSYLKLTDKTAGYLKKPIEFNGVTYSFFERIDKYPYTILVGENNYLASLRLKQAVLPNVIILIMLGLFFVIALYFFRKNLIEPVEQLSNAAIEISNGRKSSRITNIKTYEFFTLGKHLLKLKFYIKREQKLKEKQAQLMQVIKDHDKEKESFLRDMYHVLNTPLNDIINSADIARKKMLGDDIDEYKSYFNAMYDAGIQLKCFTTEFLHPELVDIGDIIEKSVKIQRKFAVENGSKLELDIAGEVPKIWADRLRIRQVILSTLYHSLYYVPNEGHSKISARVHVMDSGKPGYLVITVKDNGWGTSEKEREKDWQERFGKEEEENYSRNPDMMKLSFATIRHMMRLHHGSFDMETKKGHGAVFTIRLPYMHKDDLKIYPDDYIKDTKPIKLPKNKSKKVVNFPNKKKKSD